jgi:hypothetical protein
MLPLALLTGFHLGLILPLLVLLPLAVTPLQLYTRLLHLLAERAQPVDLFRQATAVRLGIPSTASMMKWTRSSSGIHS